MEEHVSAILHLDKTETFVRQFFDRAFCHLRSIAKNVLAAEADLTNSDHSTAFTESNTAHREHKVIAESTLKLLNLADSCEFPFASSREGTFAVVPLLRSP